MSNFSNQPGDGQSPPLRVIYGDDDVTSHIAFPEETGGGDDDPTPAEMNAFLMGFRPVIRFSTRLSA